MHDHFMRLALQEAELARRADEVPVSAVIVLGDRLVASAHNQREQLHDSTAHAEMIAITQAAEAINDWRLEGCTLYVTLEPCAMCASAVIHARLYQLVYGASDPKTGALGGAYSLPDTHSHNHEVEIQAGLLADEAAEMLKAFFRERRRPLSS